MGPLAEWDVGAHHGVDPFQHALEGGLAIKSVGTRQKSVVIIDLCRMRWQAESHSFIADTCTSSTSSTVRYLRFMLHQHMTVYA